MRNTGSIWSRLTRGRSARQRGLIFLIIFAMFFGVGIAIAQTQKSFAADTSSSRRCTHTNADGECWFGATASAKKFRNGYFHRHRGGLPVKKIFVHPKRARIQISHKIEHKIGNISGAHRTQIACHFFCGRHTKNSRTSTSCTPLYCYGCSDYCLAWKQYGELMNKNNCLSTGAPTTSKRTCQPIGLNAEVTKKGVQRGVSVVLCGAAVGVGYAAATAGAAETVGGSYPLASAIIGGIGCGWAFWSSFD